MCFTWLKIYPVKFLPFYWGLAHELLACLVK